MNIHKEVVKSTMKFIEGEIQGLDAVWLPGATTEESKRYFEGMKQGYEYALKMLKDSEHLEKLINRTDES